MVVCDKWIAIKIFEVLFCIACLVCKRITDDESIRLALYLQKISREWSLLRNITWDSVGASFGDAIYGGYLIITFGLLMGRMFGEIPNGRRIIEGILLGFGALFFIVLGGLELASLDSVPDGLVDNAAILGVLSLITAALFLIDLAGPRNIHSSKRSQTDLERNAFVYPNIPAIEKAETDRNVRLNTNGHIDPKRPTFFSDKLKNGKSPQVQSSNTESKKSEETQTQRPDPFTISDTVGYKDFSADDTDGVFETMGKTKYGSVRNGDVKHPNLTKQKETIRLNEKLQQTDTLDAVISSLREHERDMEKNASYLKLLDEKRKHNRSEFEEDLEKLNEEYMREFHKERIIKLNEANRVFPAGITKTEHERWDRYEERNVPPFPVKEVYLPELQTPIFAKIKEKSSSKSYGIYDNISNLYNINPKTDSASQTDTMKSKSNTLRASKPPTLQQIAEYFGLPHKQPSKKEVSVQSDCELPAVSFNLPLDKSKKIDDNINYNGGPSSPTDPGYVQYTAQQWNDRIQRKYSTRTPRHSPTDS